MPDELDNFIASVPPASTMAAAPTPPPAPDPGMGEADELDHFIASVPPASASPATVPSPDPGMGEMDPLDHFIASVPPAANAQPPIPFAPGSGGPQGQPGIPSMSPPPGVAASPATDALNKGTAFGEDWAPGYRPYSEDARRVANEVYDQVDAAMPGARAEQKLEAFHRGLQQRGFVTTFNQPHSGQAYTDATLLFHHPPTADAEQSTRQYFYQLDRWNHPEAYPETNVNASSGGDLRNPEAEAADYDPALMERRREATFQHMADRSREELGPDFVPRSPGLKGWAESGEAVTENIRGGALKGAASALELLDQAATLGGPMAPQIAQLADRMRRKGGAMQQMNPLNPGEKLYVQATDTVAGLGAAALSGGAAPAVLAGQGAIAAHSRAMDALMPRVQAGEITADQAHRTAALEAGFGGFIGYAAGQLPGFGNAGRTFWQSTYRTALAGGSQSVADDLVAKGFHGDPKPTAQILTDAAWAGAVGGALGGAFHIFENGVPKGRRQPVTEEARAAATEAFGPDAAKLAEDRWNLYREGRMTREEALRPAGVGAAQVREILNYFRTQEASIGEPKLAAPPATTNEGSTNEAPEAQRPIVQADERRPQGTDAGSPGAAPPIAGGNDAAPNEGQIGQQAVAEPELLNRARSPALAPVAPRSAFSKDDLMRRIKDLHAQQGGDAGGVPLDVHQFAESLPKPWTFLRDGPYAGEVKSMLAEGEGGTSMARSGAVRFTEDPSQAGGEDAITAFRDKYGGNGEDVYWQLARERSGRTGWQDTLASARASPDPELQLLAAIHDNLPDAANRKPQQLVAGADLPTWSQFELNGHQMRVEEDADGYRVLRDDDDYPVLPVDALPEVPMDKGTFRKGIEPAVPEGDVFGAEPLGAMAAPAGGTAAPQRPSPTPTPVPGGQAAAGKPPAPPPTPRIPVSPIAGGAPKKLKQIILEVGQSVGKPLRRSKLQRGVGGTYFPGSTRTVIKYDGNLDLSAHELAHLVDDRTGLVGQFFTGRAPFDHELIPHFSAHGSKPPRGAVQLPYLRAEGVAEWMRAWMVNPPAAEAAAPQLFKHFEATVPQDLRDKIRAFGDDIRRHFGLPDVEKVLTSVHTEADAPSIAQRLKRFLFGSAPPDAPFKVNAADRAVTEFFDDLHPVIKATHAAAELRDDLQPRAGGYATDQYVIDGIRTFAGGSQRFAQVLASGPVKFRSSNAAEPFERASGVNGGADWLLGTDLMKGMTPDQVRSAHRDAQAMMIGERVLEKAAQIVTAAQAKFQASLPPGTTLAAALANPVLKRRYDRIMEAARQRAGRLGGFGGGVEMDDVVAAKALAELAAAPTRQALARQMVDRYRKWADANLQYLVDGGRKTKEQVDAIRASNQFYADFHRVMDELEQQSPGGRLGNVKQPIHRFKGSTRQLENPFVNLLMQTAKVMRETDRNAVLREFTDLLRSARGMYEGEPRDLDAIGSQARPGDDDAIKIYVAGKLEHWQFQPDVHQALKGLGQAQDMNWLARGVSLVAKQIPQWAITHNPGFVFRQLFKDAISRSILSESGFRPWDVAGPQTPTTDPRYKLAGGAQGPGYMADAPEYHRFVTAALQKLAKTPGTVLALPGRAMKKLLHGVEELGDTRSRKAEYQRAYQVGLQRGMDAPEAARFAAARTRDLADWAMAGRVIRFLKPYVPFLNPGIQGIGRAWRGARANPRGFAFRMLAFVLIPRLLAYLWNSQDEERLKEYRQLPAWRRDLTLNFKVGHVWLSIPNPYELGIFGTAVERSLDAIDGGNKHPAEGLGRNAINSLSPVDESFAAGPLKPLIELMANHDFFFNRPIVPQYEEGKAMALRDSDRASRLGKVIADGIGLLGLEADPRKIDHFAYSMLGGLGTVLQDASDVGRADKPATRWLQSGVGLFTPPPAGGSPDAMRVAEQARYLGDDNSTAVRDLQAALRRQRTAPTAAERDALAKEVRDRAAFLRDFYERHGDQLLQLKQMGMQAGVATKGLNDQKPADKAAFAQGNREQLRDAAQVRELEKALAELRANQEKVYDSSLTESVKRSRLKLLDAAIDRLFGENVPTRKAG